MNSRQRFLNSLSGQPIDRFFRYEHGCWPSTRERWLLEGYPAEAGCYHDDAGFRAFFQMDTLTRIKINSGYTDSPYQPKFERHVIEESQEHMLYVDEDGITKRVLRRNEDTSMPQFVRFPVAGREDWKQIRARLNPDDALARIGDPAALIQQCANPDVATLLPLCGAFGHPRNLLGDEALSFILYDDPALLHEILNDWCELYVALIRALTALVRVDSVLIWEDMCYKNGPLISPAHFRAFMLPYYKRFITASRDCGVEGIIVDTDGNALSLIPLFLEAGVNALMPFEVQAGMDVVQIRREFGPSFCIIGGIDKRALAEGKQATEAEVERVVHHFLKSGRYIPTLDHTAPTDVSLASFQYYLQVLRRYEGDGVKTPPSRT